MRKTGQEWMSRVSQELIPNTMTKLPIDLFFNIVMRVIWINLGLMDDIHATRTGKTLKLAIKNEGVTRVTGSNEVNVGLYMGVMNGI